MTADGEGLPEAVATAVAVIEVLAKSGVRDVVVAPGSRSASLAVALHEADRAGLVRLHVRIDERSAAFLALGLARGSERPVPVVTTSGTAVANLHPAVLEAHHSAVPLVVLSCDRPAALRGTGANQTTEQAGLYGARVPSADVAPGDIAGATAALRAAVRRRGPSQVNLQLAEPLLPSELPLGLGHDRGVRAGGPATARRDGAEGSDGAEAPREVLRAGPRTVVVAGDGAGPQARLLAEAAGWPLLPEPSSGARCGANAVRTYRLLLGGPLADDIERVVVVGHPTLSRPVSRLLARGDAEIVAVADRSGVVTDPARVARHLDRAPAPPLGGEGAHCRWLAAWQQADARLSARLDHLVANHPHAWPLRVAGVVAGAVPPDGSLLVGSSQPVRDLDLMMVPYAPRQHRRVAANRGLAGIDGLVSTAIGFALGRPASRALAYLGDLTFCHDANGLLIGPREPRPDLTVVVANDDGGAIFSTLEQGEARYAPAFERVFGTPHGTDMGLLCAAHHVPCLQVTDGAELAVVLESTGHGSGLRVVEVPMDRSTRRALDAEVKGLVDAEV